jgi:type IV secretory pathway TraG/TraD family ATPase VirD4
MGLLAGYGIQPIPVLQSLSQLTIYDKEWENFVGQAGVMLHVGRTGDNFTAEYLSHHSGETTIRNPSVSTTYNPGGSPSFNTSEAYTRRPYLMPQDLMRIRDRFGFVWRAGEIIPAYFPGYFDVDRLDRRARRNPYYKG